MITNNFTRWIALLLSNNSLSTTMTEIHGNANTLDGYNDGWAPGRNGDPTGDFLASAKTPEDLVNSSLAPRGSVVVLLGDGVTQPTIGDYTMESPVTTLTNVTQNRVYTAGYNNTIVAYNSTVRNDTDANVVVSEIGVFLTVNRSAPNAMMIAHEVIDPVTIAPGDAYTFRISLEL